MGFQRLGDSYTACFYPALTAAGIDVREGIYAGRWMIHHMRGVDFVHIHWPSFLYNHPRWWGSIRQFAVFLLMLTLIRVRGLQLVWTVHNLHPHKPSTIRAFDRIARWLVTRVATKFFIHGAEAEAEAVRAYPIMAGRTVCIEHGHWVGYYPDTIKRHEARRKLGLADNEFVFLFIGLCQPYKNLHGLTAAFAALDAPAKLVIAGTFRDPSYEAKIRGDVARMDSRAQLYPGYVDDADMQIYLKACDIVVAPYLEILTSGTVMLAMSFGRPVIAPAKGFIKDVVTPGCGILYGSSDPQGLLDAMRTALTQRFDERAIRAHAASYDWVHTARTTREALEALVQNRSGNTVT